MQNLTSITNIMFRNRKDWVKVTSDDKESLFFIVNRYLSKLYPEQAQNLNEKTIDKVMAMDIWYAFMLDKPYPGIMWSKPEEVLPNYNNQDEKKSKKILFSQKDLLNLQKVMNITASELDILVKYHEKEVKEELKYLKQQKDE